MGKTEVKEYETVERKVEKYECDNCGYIGDAKEFVKSTRTPLTYDGEDEFYYCETCDGAKAIAKREKELESVADRINKISEGTLVSGVVGTYVVGSIAMSTYIMYLSDITGFGGVIIAFLLQIIGWAVGMIPVLFLIFAIQIIGGKIGVVEDPIR